MGTSLKRTGGALALLCLILGVVADDPPFPDITQIEVEFYETEVIFTDVAKEVYGIAKEYYDNTGPRGKLELKAVGSTVSVYYDNSTNEVLEVNETDCKAWDIDESQFSYEPIIYGWLNKDPLVIGPSAALWLANKRKSEAVYMGKTRVRTIECDTWNLELKSTDQNATVTYYFATEDWTTPYELLKLRVPVRIEVHGNSTMEAEESETPGLVSEINLISDFAYFKPTLSDFLIFQPPLGFGCSSKKPTYTMPTMPKVFKYSAEVFDFMKTDPSNPEYTYDVEFQQVWYDSERSVARLDKYSRTSYFSELYDFNIGVTYSNENGRSCRIKALRNSFFEAYDTHIVGHLKEPKEVLNLDGSFYYMGKRLMRSIVCDTFESVQKEVKFMGEDLDKLVITIFYSDEFFKVITDGELETTIPVYYMVKGYKDKKKIIDLQYNIFAFDDITWPDIYTSFRLERCFPSVKDKSYFVLMIDAPEELAKKMEAKDDQIKKMITEQIIRHANISEMRIPMLAIDYTSIGITVTGLMLERPPVLKQFTMVYKGAVVISDKYMRISAGPKTEEECASACVRNEKFTCLTFHFCEKMCVLNAKSVFDKKEPGEDTFSLDNCESWLRATRDSMNDEAYLVDALKSFEEAVYSQKVKITFELDEKTKKTIPIGNIEIGDGPYSGLDDEKPYNLIVNFAKLNEAKMSVSKVDFIDNINDCYKACKESETMSCASFSFCPTAANKQCMITSTLFIDRASDGPDGAKDNRDCYIYAMKYLDLYQEYPGRYSLITGDGVFDAVRTLEDCARTCRRSDKIKCRGFEYCRSSRTCILHSKHILDFKGGEVEIDPSKGRNCVHYAAKFTEDYSDYGFKLLDDNSDVRQEISLEECAKTCSEELKTSCKSFNYCPPSQTYATDSSCALSSKVLVKGDKTVGKDKCHHYEKKATVSDWKKPVKQTIQNTSGGYTSKGFTGLVIGMLAFGLIIGALGFIGYSYYRSRSSGDGMTVRFMKQPT